MDNDQIIAAYIDHLTARACATTTLKCARNDLRRLARHLDPTPILGATVDQVESYAATLARLAPSARYTALSRLSCFYDWAVRYDHLDRSPARRLIRPKLPSRVPRPIAEDRLRLALSTASPDVRCWLVLGAFAGLRACESARLTRDAVMDGMSPAMLLVTGKGSKDRTVPLNRTVLAALTEYGMPARGFVFRRRDGQPGAPSANTVSRLVNLHLRSVGVPDTAHAGRHRFLTAAYEESQDLRVVQYLAGHSSPVTTSLYARWSDQRAVDAVMSLDNRSESLRLQAGGDLVGGAAT